MKLNSRRIALTFAGCFLGAGYVSGQEMYQFFLSFGLKGLFGIFLAMLMLFVFGVLLLLLAGMSGAEHGDELIIRAENKTLRTFVGVAEIFFLLGIAVIMAAGVGALFKQLIHFPPYISSAVFCVLLFVLMLGGHERMVAVFSLTVPLLVIFTVAVSAAAYFRFPHSNLSTAATVTPGINPLLGSWWFSAITFVAYNLFSSVEIFAPLGKYIDSGKKTVTGIAGGCALLLVIALCIFFSMSLCPGSSETQLPMLAVADRISPVLSAIYALLLLLGMLGTALSSLVAVTHFLTDKIGKTQSKKVVCAALVSIFVYAGSLFGFGELIGTVYPLCGYFGTAAMLCMTEHYIHLKIKKRKTPIGESYDKKI